MTKSFPARNFDPKVKAEAEACAHYWTVEIEEPHVVEYRDHYNDYSVSGDYVVRPA